MHLTYRHTKYASYCGYITQAIINNLPPLLFLTFQNTFDISLQKIGLLISLNFGIQIIVDIFAAKYIDRIGYRKGIIAAHIFCTLGLVGLGTFPFVFPNAYAGLITAIVINALGGGLIEVLISPIVESLPGDEKATAMSLLHSFYCWGQVAVVLFSTLYFVTIGIDQWQYLPFYWALVPFMNTFLFAKVPLRTLVEEEQRIPFRRLFSAKIFWLMMILMMCSGASELAMSQWSSLFAESGLGVSKTVGDLLGPCAFAVLMGLSRVFYGVKGAKIDLKKALIASCALCVLCYGTVVFAPNPIIALVGCAVCGLSVGLMWPGVYSLSAKYYPQGGTAMFALLALAGDVGASAGPGLVGVLSNWAQHVPSLAGMSSGGLKAGLLFAAVFPICMLAGVIFLKSKRK